jgi:outer membrane lipoprotein-sorting protein
MTAGFAREILVIDPELLIPIKYTMYDDSERIIQSAEYTEIVLNCGLEKSLFTDF